MSNRGNPDHFKVGGTPTELPEVSRKAHQQLAQELARERRSGNARKGRGPESAPLRLPPAAYREHRARAPSPRRPSPPTAEPRRVAPGWSPPTVGEVVHAGLHGAFRIGSWMAATTWRYLRATTRRRIRGAVGRGRGLVASVLSGASMVSHTGDDST